MIYNNLNRVKGILSARQGAEIPKFKNSGKIYKRLPNGLEVMSSDGESWVYVDNPSEQYTLFNNYFYDLPSYNDYDRETQSIISQAREDKKSVLSSDYSYTIPGGLEATPYTAVENAVVNEERKEQIKAALDNELKATNDIQLTKITQANNSRIQDSKTIDKNRTQNAILATKAPQSNKANTNMSFMDLQLANAESDEDKNATIAANTTAQVVGGAIQGLGNVFRAQQSATDSNLTKGIDSGVDAVGGMLSQMGGIAGGIGQILQIGSAAGQIIEGITGGTDQMTGFDKFTGTGIGQVLTLGINDLFGKNSETFSIDQDMAQTVGSSYGGSMDQLNEAARTADKKYGLFSTKARRKANENIAQMKSTQNQMSNIANMATDQRLAVQSMGEQAGLAYSMMTDGGYNQKYTYAAKHGGLLKQNPVIELEWEPQVELNWELPTFKEGGNIDINEELEWIPEFKDGGKTEESDVPETEETTQKNVIPEGALHKNKHHMEHAEGLTKKGIPVVDEDGEQQAEIEHSEIIFTLEVTKKLEEYYEIFYSEASTNKEKEQAALDAGKLLVYQILENTEDRTGLIESCKKGGSLTLKKSTDDLIEEVLEWMPTIVIVEEQKESKEEEHNKEEDKSEAKNEQSDKDKMKEAIREVLIELLIK